MLETAQIDKMSVGERLQVMEQLWDALCRDSGDLPSPAWHNDVLADRKQRALHGESRFLTLDQLRARLQSSEP